MNSILDFGMDTPQRSLCVYIRQFEGSIRQGNVLHLSGDHILDNRDRSASARIKNRGNNVLGRPQVGRMEPCG